MRNSSDTVGYLGSPEVLGTGEYQHFSVRVEMDDEQLLGTEECRQSGNLFQLFAISFRNKYFFAGVNESDDAVQTLN